MAKSDDATRRYRTIFMSDLHLGTRGCQAELMLDFLRHNDADTIFLVGDIVDGWRLRSGWYWPQAHNDVIQKLLRKVRHGARMIFVPGNHDEFARQFIGLTFGGIEIVAIRSTTTADGRRLLIMHGDEFDVVVRHAKWLAFFGDWAYETALLDQHAFQPRAPPARLRLLVVFGLGQAQGQERGQFHRQLRARTGGRSQAARRRRCRLRPYSPRRDSRDRRGHLCEHRRLRRIVFRGRRALRRQAGDCLLGERSRPGSNQAPQQDETEAREAKAA